MTKPTVFISYSHRDERWKDLLRSHLGVLEQTGRITVWDDRQIDGGEEWYPEIVAAMERAAVALCLISPDFLKSDFINKEEIPHLIKRRENEGMILLPVLVRPCLWEIVDWLSPIQMLPRDDKSISADFRDNEDTPLKQVAKRVFEIVDNPDYQPPVPPSPHWPKLPEDRISIERLPKTGSEVFGRAEKLALLDEAWKCEAIHIVSFVAWGGVGKSALVNKWVAQTEEDHFRGAERVYAWSFYSQGSGERVTSADLFIDSTLRWVGDSAMADSSRSPWDKGQRLAELIQQERTLLLLDGLEPLQSGLEHDRGQVKDSALALLLKELARKNPGLCVITTREPLTGLEAHAESIKQENLEQISDKAGRALLRVGAVRGTDAELEQITRDFGNHALAINLLVAYLQEIPGKQVTYASLMPDLDIPEEDGRHPRRVMEAFVKHFGEGPEFNVLHMIGLFDRPATAKELNYLRTQFTIPGLTDHIRWLTDKEWDRVIQNLRRALLIAPESHHNLGGLDAHPLVREHFGRRLKEINEESWKQGHSGLYEFLSKSTVRFPDTIEEMAPLYQAVAHGCQAGRYQEALKMYWRRIRRGDEAFSVKKLGAFGADLAALSSFFDRPWHQPVRGLTEDYRTIVLNWAGFRLRAAGRLAEAAQLMEAALAANVAREQWRGAAMDACNLSELYLTSGDLARALDFAQQDVDLADRSGVVSVRIVCWATLANVLYEMGCLSEAEAAFRQAEEMQQEMEPEHSFLYSLRGFQYSDLLLDQGRYREVQSRAGQAIEIAGRSHWLLDIALGHLSLGRAHLLQARRKGTEDSSKAAAHLSRAVDGLRQAGQQQYLPPGLLTRAELHRVSGELERAQRDLEEAMSIATRGGMRLSEADGHLEYARLYLAMGEKDKARESVAKAKEMMEMGYHRRDKEAQELEEQLRE